MSYDPLVVRSYRRVFRIERRIHRIDRFLLPVPGGLPLRGVLYFLGALLALLALALLPGVEALLERVPAPVRYAVLPAALAVLGTQVAPDGRSAHRFALAWLAHRVRPRRRVAGRAVPPEGEPVSLSATLALAPDEHASALRRARVRGAAVVRFRQPLPLRCTRRGWRAGPRRWRRAPETRERCDLADGEHLEIRP